MDKLIYIFQYLLFLSLTGTAVIAVLYTLCKVSKTHVSNRWKYYVWLIPCAVLLLPFHTPAIHTAVVPQTTAVETNTATELPVAKLPQETPSATAQVLPAENHQTTANPIAQAAKEKTTVFTLPLPDRSTIWAGATILWLTGILLLFLRGLYHRIRFSVTMHRLTFPCSAETETVFRQLCTEMRIHRRVCLKSFGAVGSPFLSGIFRPTVYLPDVALSEAELHAALKHELTHCKRHDLLLKQIQQILAALHWFNPFVRLMLKQTEIFCELSCDEAVVSDMNREERKLYGITILKLMRGSLPVATTSAYLAEKKIKNRLETIMNYSMNNIFKKIVSIALTTVLGVGSIAFAAELNAQNPNAITTYHAVDFGNAKDIPINEYRAFVQIADGANISVVNGNATLTNNPFEKSFTADVTSKVYQYDKEIHEYSNPRLTEEARYQVSMTKLIRVLKTQGEWVGTFTVIKDGETILTDAVGTLTNVPGLENPGLSNLQVSNSDRSFRLSDMNFGLSQAELLNYEAEKDKAEDMFYQDENTEEIFLQMGEGNQFGDLNLAPSINTMASGFGSHFTLIRNNMQKKLKFSASLPEVGYEQNSSNFYVLTLEPEDILSYNEDFVTGTFLLTPYIANETPREMKGTLTGLNGGAGAPVTFSSADGKYRLNLTIAPEGTYDPDQDSSLAFYRWNTYRYITMEELPFDVSIDGNDVTVRYKGDSNLRWAAVLASYSAPEETWQPIPQERAVDGKAVFHLIPNYTDRQYLCMDVYSVGEGAKVTSYELSMKEQKNGVIFTQLSEKKDGENTFRETDVDGIPTTIKFHYGIN